ncbi:hypothetical protein [Cohnella panacarvi]|uniref:hypothetical protein n=1 Tax=Cohnella panacarvi TaxID=400776 RepID=UPI00047EC79C|nr:hypothetical protein [Cohnella panacarvi]
MVKRNVLTKLLLAILALFWTQIILGCSTHVNSVSDTKEVFQEYKQLIKNSFEDELKQNLKSINLVYTKDSTYGDLSYVLFSTQDNDYEGSVIVDRNHQEILFQTLNKIDKSVPFTKLEMSGLINNKGRYHIISGFIRDDEITDIVIKFSTGLIVNVTKSEENTYSYVLIDEPEGNIVIGVEGINKDGEQIFAY